MATKTNPFRVGDRIYLISDLRSKDCRCLGIGVATRVETIRIQEPGRICLGTDEWLSEECCHAIAQADGFHDALEMLQWFRDHNELPFEGRLIAWDLEKADQERRAA